MLVTFQFNWTLLIFCPLNLSISKRHVLISPVRLYLPRQCLLWVFYFNKASLGPYTLKFAMISLSVDHLIFKWCPFLFLIFLFEYCFTRNRFSEYSFVFFLPLILALHSFLYPFTFNLFMSLNLEWVSYRSHVLSRSVMSDSLEPMDHSLPDSPVHGDSTGKSTGVGCHALLQGIFPTQVSNLGVLQGMWILYRLSLQGSPK